MTIYYQHVGEQGAGRDFPKTIGTEQAGLKRFSFSDVVRYLDGLTQHDKDDIERICGDKANNGFQIWGIPSGAKVVLANMVPGDILLLLETNGPGGFFRYAGQVICKIPQESFRLSQHLWGESRFPIIIFLLGSLITYPWYDFCDAFGIKRNYDLRGKTANLKEERLYNSVFRTEEDFLRSIITGYDINDPPKNDLFQMFVDREIRTRETKARLGQQKFKAELVQRYGLKCAVCSIDKASLLDGAHLIPWSGKGSDDPRNGIVFCALHHRAFDSKLFAIEPNTFEVVLADGVSNDEIFLGCSSIRGMNEIPAKEALEWCWKDWIGHKNNH